MVPNRILASLSTPVRERLIGAGTLVDLAAGQQLAEPAQRLRYVYFPSSAFISLITTLDGEPDLEVSMVGYEGMLGIQVALGIATSPAKATVQGAGQALRLTARAFRLAMLDAPALRKSMLRYVGVLIAQSAGSAACLHYHLLAPRMARWLLDTHDRARTADFDVTQELLAAMLGVRRAGVTQAAGELQRAGVISYSRGRLAILDRVGLEAASCGCYAAQGLAYSSVMG